MLSPIERLSNLIQYAQQSALLKATPPMQVSQHGQFLLPEDKLRGLPGITLNVQPEGDFDEVWLNVERLHETPPPSPESKLLALWLELPASPQKEPGLKPHVSREKLIEVGALIVPAEVPEVPPPNLVSLETFERKGELRALFKSYVEVLWRPWSLHEREVRKSIAVYADLFMLSQQLQGNLLDSQLELAWGVGIGVWQSARGAIHYPLITQLAEITLNEKTMALEVRPRSVEPRLEVDIYAVMDNPGVANLSDAAKQFFKTTGGVLSPFDPSTFEGLLKSAATLLDASGTYWPNQTTADDRAVPRAGENLVVTDTWVLFARPRTTSLFIQDLERFAGLLSSEGVISIPGAVGALVTEPQASAKETKLVAFRGLSPVTGTETGGANASNPAELYFPMAYNDEQVQIVQMLEANDGVVVQGPPGTGKTHTIANVICHYLALGKRVLVTSMKDPALAVLQEKLPESIRPLAVSLLTSEAEGMKQFEFAINKIAAEITRIDKSLYRQEIQQIDGQIESLHGQIAKVDKEIALWAKRNLERVIVEGEELTPLEIAEEVSKKRDEVSWFPDGLTLGPEHNLKLKNQEVLALRLARQQVGADLVYLGKRIPNQGEFPDTAQILEVHQDLNRLQELTTLESKGAVPSLSRNTPEAIQQAMALVSRVSNLRLVIQQVDSAQQPWTVGIFDFIRKGGPNEIMDIFLQLRLEIEGTLDSRKQFLIKPVTAPDDLDANSEMMEAIRNLAQDKKPFGLAGLFGKAEQKKTLESVVVVSAKPSSAQDWAHVLKYLELQAKCRSLLVRWNTLAAEMGLPHLEPKPSQLTAAGNAVALIDKVAHRIQEEKEVGAALQALLPSWSSASRSPYTVAILDEAETILTHHLTRSRLAQTWLVKETFHNALAGCEGPISAKLLDFLNNQLGASDLTVGQVQAIWSGLMEELRHVHSFSTQLHTIQDICGRVADCGAPKWAGQLQSSPCLDSHDALLPDNWKDVWRLVRLVNFVDGIDGRQELRKLSIARSGLESDLAKQYREAVTKRTWLRLAENATQDVTSALEAYRIAIKKIGKGTGVKSARYRHDARVAADKANAAIPCWIMPHYRISESLPSQLGCFDLVIIDEASQSDLTALPALLRASKVLVVGDDKQVSPEGVGLEEEKIRNLMTRFLADQVQIYRPQMAPDRSIYDLFKVVFASSSVMLREHFRCVAPIIEYSKREFYNHELRPLRMPKSSERMDPPLVDLHVLDGHRNNHINHPEARVIVDEIRRITENPEYVGRTIGVVSLLGSEQALFIMKLITEELGEYTTTKFKITCGDARTFQGKERDIMFLSMVVSPGKAHAQGTEMFAQRFNVAASRARDRMYLVRSVQLEDLSAKDVLRAKLLQHFQSPFMQAEEEVADLRQLCESPFEREVFDILTERGYKVVPQVRVGSYRIDMVVEGDNDNRLAIECDGDQYHGPAQWDADMRRQRILERAGWRFWRSFASTFVMHRADVVKDLIATLNAMDIHPTTGESTMKTMHSEAREVYAFPPDAEAGVPSVEIELPEVPEAQVVAE